MPGTEEDIVELAGSGPNAAMRVDVAKVLHKILQARTGNEGAGWSDATLLKDTGVDSFTAIECIFELEEHYNVDFNFNANSPDAKLETIGDFVDMATRAVAGQSRT